MDGTLIDTDYANFLAYKKAIESVIKGHCDLNYNLKIRFNRSNLKNIVPHLSENKYEKIIQRKEEYYHVFLPKTKLIKPVVDILFKYSKTNKTVLVTNSYEKRALETLNYHGLTDKFSSVFCKQFTDSRTNKFKNAILKLGVIPNSIIVFENEKIEIAHAKQAGITIINPIII